MEYRRLAFRLRRQITFSAVTAGRYHDGEHLIGMQVLCATDLRLVQMAGFKSKALTVGVPGNDGNPVLVIPEKTVTIGGMLY